MNLLSEILKPHNLADILLVAAIIYTILSLFRGTVAAQVLKGMLVLGIVVSIALYFNLETLTWIIERLTTVVLVGVVVLFQPELRRGLARIGERSFGSFFSMEGERVIEEITTASAALSAKRHGALIVLERESGLEPYIERGTLLNAEVTEDLLLTIFMPKTPLHDGAVIIRGNSLIAASCILPLAHEENLRYGTRHRAALGLTKETDAVVVVISEETGRISLAAGGKLVSDIDANTLKEMLTLYVGGAAARRGVAK